MSASLLGLMRLLAGQQPLGEERQMTDEVRKPDARPPIRRLAGGLAIVCFILVFAYGFASEGDSRPATYTCLAIGVTLAGIALAGDWPWWGRGKP
jgi:hypothetical protein